MVTMLLQELILGVRSLRAMLEKTKPKFERSEFVEANRRDERKKRKLSVDGESEQAKSKSSRRADETHASLSSRSPGTSISSLSLSPFPLLSSFKLIGVD